VGQSKICEESDTGKGSRLQRGRGDEAPWATRKWKEVSTNDGLQDESTNGPIAGLVVRKVKFIQTLRALIHKSPTAYIGYPS
jgi:hypothetical protein